MTADVIRGLVGCRGVKVEVDAGRLMEMDWTADCAGGAKLNYQGM